MYLYLYILYEIEITDDPIWSYKSYKTQSIVTDLTCGLYRL